jgi:phosphopantothenoylcysteine synthetase/decarboxylase
LRWLLTAGATRNPVDAMRVLTANATGSTSVEVASYLQNRGYQPLILGSAEATLRAKAVGLVAEEFGSTRDLMSQMALKIKENPKLGLVHAAAVGDYELDGSPTGKIPSGQDRVTLTLRPTPKIADHVRGWGHVGPYVTFKAAPPDTGDEELVAIAVRQRARTGCDLVFANVLGRTATRVFLVGDGVEPFAHRRDAVDALARWCAARSC